MSLKRSCFIATFAVLAIAAPARADEDSNLEARKMCGAAYENAQILMKKDALQAARSELARCVAPECAAFVRTECGNWQKEMADAIPSASLTITDSAGAAVTPTKLTVDGVDTHLPAAGAALELDPGKHTIEATNGTAHASADIVAERGKKNVPLKIVLASPAATEATSSGHRMSPLVLPIAVAGVGVAALATSLVLGAVAKSELSDLDSCKGHCAKSQVDPVDTKITLSSVFFGVAVVALGVSAVLYFTRDKGAAWTPSSVVTF